MRWLTREIAFVVLVSISLVCAAQNTDGDDAIARQTQSRGHWMDPASGLMWAAKDNGKDVNWHQATSYCRNLRLGGYADWRLATIDELEDLIDIKAYAPERVGTSTVLHFNRDRKVHGGLLLTGLEWSSSQRVDDRGKLAGIAWYFDFVNVQRIDDNNDVGLRDKYDKRALCVREPEKASNIATEPREAATYPDPATGLSWAGKDNGKDVDLNGAMKYCSDLRADGYSAWRLPTIEELEGISGSDAKLGFSGDPWSNSRATGRFWWYLSRKSGTRVFDEPSFGRAKRAVCVHGPSAQPGGRATLKPGYWIDPATELMWAATDSLGGTSIYMDAMVYCQAMRVGGFQDWRLATAKELESIYDPNIESPGAVPRTRWQAPEAATFHVKGGLFLTGLEWINTSDNDDRNPSKDRSVFDFKGGKLMTEKRYFVEAGALCVRGKAR